MTQGIPPSSQSEHQVPQALPALEVDSVSGQVRYRETLFSGVFLLGKHFYCQSPSVWKVPLFQSSLPAPHHEKEGGGTDGLRQRRRGLTLTVPKHCPQTLPRQMFYLLQPTQVLSRFSSFLPNLTHS